MKQTALRSFAIVALCALVLTVSACFSPLQGVEDGTLAVRLSFPDGIHTMENESLVGRLYVVNAAYEVLLRTVLAYEDFLDVFYYDIPIEQFADYPMLLPVLLRLEEILDDLEEDLMLKAPVMFGGKPFYDFSVSNPTAGGSVTPPGVPADRAYFVYLDMWYPGEQDKDDADPVFESVAWYERDPYEELLSGFAEIPSDQRLATVWTDPLEAFNAARTLFNNLKAAYLDSDTYPFIPATFVRRGRTATVQLQMRALPTGP